jgi:hypothetical protein
VKERHSAPTSLVIALITGGLGGYNEYRFHGSLVWAAFWFVVWFAIGFAGNQSLANALRIESKPSAATIRQSAIMAAMPIFFLSVIWFAFERYIEINGGPVARQVPHSERYREPSSTPR